MMKKRSLVLLLLVVMPLLAPFNPETKQITEAFFPDKTDLPETTPALQKKNGFTNYDELMAFLHALQKDFPEQVQIQTIGTSKKGKDIPMVTLQTITQETPVKVWMQGGLHGDEPASTEALLYLMHRWLHHPEDFPHQNQITLGIVPMANIDGFEKQQRNNAENLDLNRDQTKLMAFESAALKQAFVKFEPHVALDFHEYRPYRRDFVKMGAFGVAGAYDVMFLYTGNPNVPQALRTITQEKFLTPTRARLDAENLSHFDYVTPTDHFGAIQFNRGSSNARSSVTNYALMGTIATLVEVRGVGIGRTSFKRRVHTGFLVAQSFLAAAVADKNAVMATVAAAKNPQDNYVVTTKKNVYGGQLQFIDVDKIEKISMPVTFRDGLGSTPKLWRVRPKAYVLKADQKAIAAKLQTLGFSLEAFDAPQSLEVESYRITAYKKVAEPYEKMKLQEVETALEPIQMTFGPGDFYLSTDQPRSHLLPELMEPEAPNSFVSFGVLPTGPQEILPIYRIPNKQ
jgi:hypothetical protein